MASRPKVSPPAGNDTRTAPPSRPPLRTVLAPTGPPAPAPSDPADAERDRRLRRARFLADLAEARELRKRVAPRRARSAEMHAQLLRTFRY